MVKLPILTRCTPIVLYCLLYINTRVANQSPWFAIGVQKQGGRWLYYFQTPPPQLMAYQKLNINKMHPYSILLLVVATVSSLELPTDLHDSNWNYNSEEGNGLIIFYKGKMVFNGKEVWNLVSLTGNFMSFQRYFFFSF